MKSLAVLFFLVSVIGFVLVFAWFGVVAALCLAAGWALGAFTVAAAEVEMREPAQKYPRATEKIVPGRISQVLSQRKSYEENIQQH